MMSSDKLTIGNVILATISILMLICGLAPIGLFQVARTIGIDTHGVGSFPPGVPFYGLALALILILGISAIFKSGWAIRIALWLIFGIAVLNLGGCVSMWNDLRGVH